MATGDQYERRQEEAIAALICSKTIKDAAMAINIDVGTLNDWMRKPAFQTAYRWARRQLVEAAIGRVQQACAAAVSTLERNLSCGLPGIETTAAKAILEFSLRAVELSDIEERLGKLETAFNERQATAGEVGRNGAGWPSRALA